MKFFHLFAAILLLVLSSLSMSESAVEKPAAQKLVFGFPPFVSSEYILKTYQPLLNYIEQQGVFKVELKTVGKEYEDFLRSLTVDDYDVLVLPAHWALPLIENMPYKPLLRSKREFQAVLFTHENSGINKLQDLKNRRVATVGDLSLAASVLRRVMQVQGISPEKHITIIKESTTADVIKAVRNEQADVGVIIEMVDKQLEQVITGSLKVISKLSAGPAVVLTGKNVSEDQRKLLYSYMFGMVELEKENSNAGASSSNGFEALTERDLFRFKDAEGVIDRFIKPSGQ